eukprot:COSAG06_NODE_9507_length_1884_cov_1.657143_2_plen_358_part_00
MFCYIGSSGPGQAVTADSPGFGKVTVDESKTGIVVARLGEDGELTPAGMVELDSHVGWLTQHPTNGHLYCVAGSNVLGMKIGEDGSLSAPFTSADAAGGSAYLDLTKDGKWALSASYGGSLLSILPIADDGTVGAPTDVLHHDVPLNPALADRQEACHPHQVRVDLTQQWALVPDLGASRVWIYGLPGPDGKFVRDQRSDAHLILPEGAGPRHLDFHPNGKVREYAAHRSHASEFALRQTCTPQPHCQSLRCAPRRTVSVSRLTVCLLVVVHDSGSMCCASSMATSSCATGTLTRASSRPDSLSTHCPMASSARARTTPAALTSWSRLMARMSTLRRAPMVRSPVSPWERRTVPCQD